MIRGLLPRSLAGQLITVLVAALLASHLITQSLGARANSPLSRAGQIQVRERFGAAYRVLVLCQDQCVADSLLPAFAAEDVDYALSPAPPTPTPMSAQETALAHTLALGLRQEGVHTLDLHVAAAKTGWGERLWASSLAKITIKIAAPLPDGRWLAATIHAEGRNAWWQLLLTLAASVIPVLIVSVIFARRLLHPLQAISVAAESISRGERSTLTCTHGPKELREVAQAFNLMQERLGRFVGERTRILAAISHDIRTPLTSLRLRAELADDPKQRAAMRETVEDLIQMAESCLRFARDDSLYEDTSLIDFPTLLTRLCADHAVLGHWVSWHGPARLELRCRPQALGRAVNNLIDNAIRYGGQARITLSMTDTGLSLTVDDDGPGIALSLMEQVFEPFFRPGSDRHRESGGAGLGLAIARSCVEAHGGRLTLANRPEGGLRARIILPTERPAR